MIGYDLEIITLINVFATILVLKRTAVNAIQTASILSRLCAQLMILSDNSKHSISTSLCSWSSSSSACSIARKLLQPHCDVLILASDNLPMGPVVFISSFLSRAIIENYKECMWRCGWSLVPLWIMEASIPLGFFASIWDIKVSWGFLAKGAKHKYLRSTLSLKKHPRFYYLAFATNFLLRLFWVLAISPGVTVFFKQPYICMLVFGFIELVRRVLWNFLTMENMHII